MSESLVLLLLFRTQRKMQTFPSMEYTISLNWQRMMIRHVPERMRRNKSVYMLLMKHSKRDEILYAFQRKRVAIEP